MGCSLAVGLVLIVLKIPDRQNFRGGVYLIEQWWEHLI